MPARYRVHWKPWGAGSSNLYGPTETTIWSAANGCRVAKMQCAPPIGRPMSNTQIYVLDAGLSLCRRELRGSFTSRARVWRGAIWGVPG